MAYEFCWYRTTIEVPKSYAGRRVWLNFDGINYAAEADQPLQSKFAEAIRAPSCGALSANCIRHPELSSTVCGAGRAAATAGTKTMAIDAITDAGA